MTPRLRVLFVDHETRLSGGERNLVELIESFDPGRIEVHLAVPGAGPLADRASAAGATVHVLALDPALLSVSRWDLARRPTVALRHAASSAKAVRGIDGLVRRLRPDIVHSSSQKAHLLAAPVTLVRRTRHVWHMQDILERGWLRRLVLVVAHLSASRLVCLSEATAEPLRVGRLARRVRVVYSGVAQEPADPVASARWRQDLGVAAGQPLVGMVGQIARWKGQDILVEAVPDVLRSHPTARFAIVGECLFPDNEGDYDAATRLRAESLGLAGCLTFTGPVEPIEPLMAALDVLVHASRLPEPFGRVIAEAMVQGTPVVTNDLGAGPELVSPDAGRVIPADDPRALAAALVELLEPGVLRGASERAREVGRRFNHQATRDGVLAVYDELLR